MDYQTAVISEPPQTKPVTSSPKLVRLPIDPIPPPIASHSLCYIRPYHPNDAEPMAKQADNPNISQWMTNAFPSKYTVEAGRKWITMCLTEPEKPNFVITTNPGEGRDPSEGLIIGSCGLKPGSDVHTHTAEIGYWVGEEYWGRGIASAACQLLTDWTFRNKPEMTKLQIAFYSGNKGSEKVAIKNGFVYEGTLRGYVNKYGKLMDLHNNPPRHTQKYLDVRPATSPAAPFTYLLRAHQPPTFFETNSPSAANSIAHQGGEILSLRLRHRLVMTTPTQLAYRTSKGIGLLNAAPVYEAVPAFTRPEGNLRCCVYSPDGRYFAWASPEQISVVDASVGHVVTALPEDNVFELGFSPLGTYLITWQRPTKDADGNATKNLKVWRVADDNAGSEGQRNAVGKFVQKSQTGWNLQYTFDEQFCARVVTNEVQFYKSADLGTVWNKLRVEGVTDFALSPGKNHSVAVFIPERKGQPAAVKVYNVPQFDSAVSQKTFFKGDKVQLKWNALGTSLIVLAQTEVDKTNKSYYGETNMYILSANGGFDARITLDKEGPIHDVAWNPNSKEFGVVYGYMPATTTIFDQRAVAKHHFQVAPRNTILFSPHGRFVLVAGFGNLAGQMDIYDIEKNYNKVTTIQASNSSVCEWSPDGKHILTATTSPRLRVDNGVRVWHISGGVMYNEDMHELYHVCWRPQSTAQHPLGDPFHPVPTPHSSALAYLSTVKTPSKPAGAYRPPGARGTTTPLVFKREDEGGQAYSNNGISSNGTSSGPSGAYRPQRRREVPGAEALEPPLPPGAAPGGGVSLAGTGEGADPEMSKTALKNKKKREAKKAKEAAEKAAGLAAAGEEAPKDPNRSPERRGGRGHERSRSKGQNGGPPREKSQRRTGSRQRDHSHQRNQSGQVDNWRIPQNQQQQPQQQDGIGQAPQTTAEQSRQDIRQKKLEIPPNTVMSPPDLTVTSPGGASPGEKKVRSLLKKLRAIEDLKMRQAGGEKLEDTQVRKILTEESIRKELSKLGHVHDS
ncbi:eIF2A-domain-containing protein [Patellaria atrata CBS 101060]|uniref:Eukaryotic translation initiation factor 2A n=1 Tax=Patellaria atrata CBS 101060 TaxID=1346257 RepID=A0A9P4S9K4_9PEZI|nr:eIF2A-domain-containing protein [Patellaria atrata CBS 101060]